MKKTATAAATLALAGLALSTVAPAQAQESTGEATTFASHSVASTWAGGALRINDLAVHDGRLVAAWGDYGSNTGPTDVRSYDPSTGAERLDYTMNGEAIKRFRVIDGALYAADVDPKLSWTANVGYATNDGGTWRYVAATPFIHVFDVAEAGGRIFLAGSIVNPDKTKYGPQPYLAAVKSSADGGQTWTIERTRSSAYPNSSDGDRYYSLTTVGETVYTRAMTDTRTPIEKWENGVWTELDSTYRLYDTVYGNEVVGGNFVAAYNNGYSIEGVSVQSVRAKGSRNSAPQQVDLDGRVGDFFMSGSTLYGVFNNIDGSISVRSTSDGLAWAELTRIANPVPDVPWQHGSTTLMQDGRATALAVVDGIAFIGGNDGAIYKTPLAADVQSEPTSGKTGGKGKR